MPEWGVRALRSPGIHARDPAAGGIHVADPPSGSCRVRSPGRTGGRVPVATGTAPGLGQSAVTSIILGFAARGAGTLTSSMPLACFAFTSAASTPSGTSKLRWNVPYATSRTK